MADYDFYVVEGETFTLRFGYWYGEDQWFTYDVATQHGTAGAADYFPESYSGYKNLGTILIDVRTFNDSVYEGDESFTLNVSGTYGLNTDSVVNSYSWEYTVHIVDDDKFSCVFDLNADGVIDDVDKAYSEQWQSNAVFEMQIATDTTKLQELHEAYTRLLQMADANRDAYLADVAVYTINLATAGVGNGVAKLGAFGLSTIDMLWNVANGQTTIAEGSEGLLLDAASLVDDVLKNPVSFLPIISTVAGTIDIRNKSQLQIDSVESIKNSLDQITQQYTDIQARIQAARAARDALVECVSKDPSSSNLQQSAFSSQASASSVLAANSTTVIQTIAAEAFSDHIFVAKGTASADVINSSGAAGEAYFMIDADKGDDIVSVRGGINYVFGGDGYDTVRIEAAPGQLASSINNVFEKAGPANSFQIMDSAGFFLAGYNDARFEYQDGYIEVLNGVATYHSKPTNGADLVLGRAWDDQLSGAGGADEIHGFDGNDRIDGGAGTDTMHGGAGDDTYVVDVATDVIVEAAGNGTADRVMARSSYALGKSVEVELLTTVSSTATTAINLTGNAFRQEIVGNAGANTLRDGGGVADLLKGLGGDDTYMIYAVGTTVVETATGGVDRVMTAVDYTLGAGVHIELLTTTSSSGTGAINLTGNTLRQEITGNAGANVLSTGGGAADTLKGLGGNDTYRVYNSGDVIIETSTADTADRVIAAVDYRLGAGVRVEIMTTNGSTGKSGIDLTGNEFAQEITGNAGDNRIEGREGNDVLRGLGGKDTFVFNTKLGASNIDTILDFNVADDRFLLSDAIFKALSPGMLPEAAFRANTTGVASASSDRIIYETDTGKLFYDADGLGGSAGIQFAKIGIGLGLTHEDFSVA